MSESKTIEKIPLDGISEKGMTIKENTYKKNGKTYSNWIVQGWRENGKWQRRQFKEEAAAKLFKNDTERRFMSAGANQRLLSTSLDEMQLRHAEAAVAQLGSTYTLRDAVRFFLENHRAPDFTIPLLDGINKYLGELESTLRANSIRSRRSVLMQLEEFTGGVAVHEVTTEQIKAFLNGLRAKDGTKAKRKTWNNYRNDVNHFFSWACEEDLNTNRPWSFTNPCAKIPIFTAKQVAEQRAKPSTTSAARVKRSMSSLMNWREGSLMKFFALAYFAGIRPDGELQKLATREKELINLKTRTIHIPADISKTKEERNIDISENLMQWLKLCKDKPIVPTNFDRLCKRARRSMKLDRDETRHSFISYHVALNRSVGDAALQAGNSESIIKKHYLRLHTREEGEAFFSIVPDAERKRAVFSDQKPQKQGALKVI
ncbi:phage integrase N-terminal SAM-like domain-containing protein [Verrucomicrobiaceae bacterium N1E253]|uniref:Phage integrase N-terminal SAM-like domain-containing protein n=1 Tax=Oceaniferula marina TaxID=2748318 RepID=A0A851GI54_9BACT|nr:phage integrase N-terminal SAM-like domain-containing protein [Oceaniferula marina]NWK54310.1 phage integrase N-terminal SAM-like domain-containing protein [Oceaniferula marina]